MEKSDLYLYQLRLVAKYRDISLWTDSTRQAIVEHKSFLERLGKEGKLIFAGHTICDPDNKELLGLALIQAGSREEALSLLSSDPGVIHGIHETVVLPFAMGIRYFNNILTND